MAKTTKPLSLLTLNQILKSAQLLVIFEICFDLINLGINDEGVRINIGAPPKEGEANKELVEFLAGVLGAKKSEVYLDKGSKSKSKILVVEGADPKDVYESLKESIEE